MGVDGISILFVLLTAFLFPLCIVASWKSITSRYSDVPPGVGKSSGIWEFEYDIWLNGIVTPKSTEIMIWTFDNGQAPAGHFGTVPLEYTS